MARITMQTRQELTVQESIGLVGNPFGIRNSNKKDGKGIIELIKVEILQRKFHYKNY